jgi:formate hydrogenlyase subunit 3/multisubunit Na+/H+ antiporter MnhD subunit
MTVALVFAAVGVLVLGVFPGPLLELAERSAASLLQIPAGLTRFGP